MLNLYPVKEQFNALKGIYTSASVNSSKRGKAALKNQHQIVFERLQEYRSKGPQGCVSVRLSCNRASSIFVNPTVYKYSSSVDELALRSVKLHTSANLFKTADSDSVNIYT